MQNDTIDAVELPGSEVEYTAEYDRRSHRFLAWIIIFLIICTGFWAGLYALFF